MNKFFSKRSTEKTGGEMAITIIRQARLFLNPIIGKVIKWSLFPSTVIERCKIFITCFGLALFLTGSSLQAQILKDTTSINLIKKGIDYVYNFKFNDAHEIWREINKLYPGNPVGYLFKGMITYWENYPLLPSSVACVTFEADLHTCIELCEKNKTPALEAENLLANLCARGFLLLFYTDNDLSIEVFPLATSTYQYIRRSFNFTSDYSDFLFFTGLYYYYREVYPEAYPIYKPLAVLFPKGDRVKGLKQLLTVANNSIVLKAESFSFLSGIFLSFENNFQQATHYSKSLHDLYPDNLEYLGAYIKNLLLIKQYDEAEKEMRWVNTNLSNSYFQAQISIFKGILQEKKYHDIKKAQQFYIEGAREMSLFGSYGNEYAAYAYFGLSHISDISGDKYYKKMYRKLASKLAVFPTVDFD
jgi:tetratricopeptide (TPR) repeat protein